MRKTIFLTTLLATSLLTSSLYAQYPTHHSGYLKKAPKVKKFYVGASVEAIFSTATIHHDAGTPAVNTTSTQSINTLGIIRFTGTNIGATFNFNLSPHFGIYTGVDIKNVGYIEQDNGYTLKRRTYNVGVPLGIKIGNMANDKGKLFLGAGVDAPINYNEKYYHDRDNKKRINEWFSDRTPSLMPYVFLGATFDHGVSIKLQYYPNNFLNKNYTDNLDNTPYAGTDVNLVLLSIGFNIGFNATRSDDHDNQYKSNW